MSFNKLTPEQAERLALLAEECGELVQAIGKILRHGYNSSNPLAPDSLLNLASLERECGDVVASIEILERAGDISAECVNSRRISKHERVWKWMHHAKKGLAMTTAPREPTLKPCPFCGSSNIDPAGWMDGDGNTGPVCDDCGAAVESVDAWNRRAALQSAEGEG